MLKRYMKMQQAGVDPGAGGGDPGADPGKDPGADPGGGDPGVINVAKKDDPIWTDSITDPDTKNWVISKGYKDLTALSLSAHNLEKVFYTIRLYQISTF